MKILIVEDNAINQSLIDIRLKKMNYETHIVNNGKEALEYLEVESPDLILMDMKMPVLDGYATTKLIRLEERLKDIPIIGLSANALKKDILEALNSGCDDYLTKPVNFAELKLKISSLISKRNV